MFIDSNKNNLNKLNNLNTLLLKNPKMGSNILIKFYHMQKKIFVI